MDGIAYQEGRFSPASEIKIFDEPLYQKNKNKIPDVKKNANPFVDIVPMKMVPLKMILKPYDEAFPITIKTSKDTLNGALIPDYKIFDKTFPTIKTPKDTIKPLISTYGKFPFPKTSNNFNQKSYTAVPLKNNGNVLGTILLTGTALLLFNAIYQANKKKDAD